MIESGSETICHTRRRSMFALSLKRQTLAPKRQTSGMGCITHVAFDVAAQMHE